VNDISARVIDNASLPEESASPKTVSSNRIRECDPKWNEDHPSMEVHPSKESTSHNDNSNSRENELEIHHCAKREVLA
jgi:hypothetical protein